MMVHPLRAPAKAGASGRMADRLVILPEVPAFAGTQLEVLK